MALSQEWWMTLKMVDGSTIWLCDKAMYYENPLVLAMAIDRCALLRPCSASAGAIAPLHPMGPDAVGADVATGLTKETRN